MSEGARALEAFREQLREQREDVLAASDDGETLLEVVDELLTLAVRLLEDAPVDWPEPRDDPDVEPAEPWARGERR